MKKPRKIQKYPEMYFFTSRYVSKPFLYIISPFGGIEYFNTMTLRWDSSFCSRSEIIEDHDWEFIGEIK